MSRPALRTHKKQIYAKQAHQIWGVFLLTIITALYDVSWNANFLTTKSIFVGSLLQFTAQSAFTYIAYRYTAPSFPQQIMRNMYLGQIIKWLIVLFGFAIIFVLLKPIIALWVFVGYVIMQIIHGFGMWRLH